MKKIEREQEKFLPLWNKGELTAQHLPYLKIYPQEITINLPLVLNRREVNHLFVQIEEIIKMFCKGMIRKVFKTICLLFQKRCRILAANAHIETNLVNKIIPIIWIKRVPLVFLQETELEAFDRNLVKLIWSLRHIGWIELGVVGSLGGVIILWNQNSVQGVDSLLGSFSFLMLVLGGGPFYA